MAGNLQGALLWRILGSRPALLPATDTFRVPFGEKHSVRLFANTDSGAQLRLAMTLADQLADNLSVTALVELSPAPRAGQPIVIRDAELQGDGGSMVTAGSLQNLTSTGLLGDVVVNGPDGIGNITAPSIFGNIRANRGAITGALSSTGIRIDPFTGDQTEVTANIGQLMTTSAGTVVGSTLIYSKRAMTGSLICRGDLVSYVMVSGGFTGVIAVQGDIGAIRRTSAGDAVTTSSGALTRYSGIAIGGNVTGQIVALGNVFGDIRIGGSLTGRLAVGGRAVAGLSATRIGVLSNVVIKSVFASSAAVASGGLIGDSVSKTVFSCGKAQGLLAADGSVNLARSVRVAPANLFQNQEGGANGAVIDAIFTDGLSPLTFDTGGTLAGLSLVEADLASLHASTSGALTGTAP